jgi:hypothetical protein
MTYYNKAGDGYCMLIHPHATGKGRKGETVEKDLGRGEGGVGERK